MKLYINKMLFASSVILIESELIRLRISYKSIKPGEIELDYEISEELLTEFKMAMNKFGFELSGIEMSVSSKNVKTC